MAFNFQGNQMSMGGQGGMMGGGVLGGSMMTGGMMPGGVFPLHPPLPDQPPLNPAINDQPLEFNTTKNKPPLPIPCDINESPVVTNTSDKDRDRRRDRNRSDKSSHNQQDWNFSGKDVGNSSDESTGATTISGANPGGISAPMAQWAPANPMIAPGPIPPYMMGMSPLIDPNMMMSQYGMMGGGMMPNANPPNEVQREVIHLKSVSLVPPPPGVTPPTMRVKPPGCKTIFVGGLAENTTEDILREIFEQCGEILIVRLNSKRFCHIRFMEEASVDAALFFSGYRMRVDNKTDAPNTGRLHVDFAQARDDQYEWECKQRQLQREARHREKVEKERFRVPSPPPVPHYTETEAASIADKIKNEGFGQAVQVVITWLERGDCNKRNSSVFYSMIQSTNSHIRRLLQEKVSYEEELQKAKDLMKARIQTILLQYAQIERVFVAASHKKVWDHFTKAQRKNIEMWSKQAAEIKAVELEEHLNTGGDDEMDVSSDEDTPKKKPKNDIHLIKEENDGLKCQVEAYKNEIDIVKLELKSEIDAKEAKLRVTQQTVQTLQQKLVELTRSKAEEKLKVRELKAELAKAKEVSSSGEVSTSAASTTTPPPAPIISAESSLSPNLLPERQAKLIGMICMFLHIHPFGASVDYLWSYLEKLEPSIRNSDIEAVLYGFPSMFEQEVTGIGANVERKWVLKLFPLKQQDSVIS